MNYAEESLRLHEEWKGKIEVVSRVPVSTKDDLSLAYTPGVAQPCLEIQKDPTRSYDLTRRHNLCAVITDGSAAEASQVMSDQNKLTTIRVNPRALPKVGDTVKIKIDPSKMHLFAPSTELRLN